MKVTIVDYGIGNLLSVARGFDYVGADVVIADTPELIESAQRLVLPGVGAFGDGMDALRDRGFTEPLKNYAASGKFLLGICLGMQMLLDSSEEFGESDGLGLIPGKVLPIPAAGINGQAHKIPHIGWNELIQSAGKDHWEGSVLAGMTDKSACYFVHSYMCVPENIEHRVADSYYDGQCISAVIQKENITGTQFHPEKSGKVGLAILKNFVDLQA